MKTPNYKKHYSKEEIDKRIEAKKKLGKDIVETLQYGEAEKKRMDMVRKRSSYTYFEKCWNGLPKKLNKNDKSTILLMIWRAIDNYKGFHYEKNSSLGYSCPSLSLGLCWLTHRCHRSRLPCR